MHDYLLMVSLGVSWRLKSSVRLQSSVVNMRTAVNVVSSGVFSHLCCDLFNMS